MMKINLIAFDYDRVLTDENLTFNDKLKIYFDDMRKNGILVGINTGRRWKFIERMKDNVDFIIYENGFFLYYKEHINIFDETQEKIALNARNILISKNYDCIFGDLLISCTLDKFEKIKNEFKNVNDIDFVTNIDRFLILPKGINKGNALKFFINKLNIDQKNVAVVGDGENDISMFKIAGFPACIGNSIEELKRISKFCSKKSYYEGTLEILSYLKERNYEYDENINLI